MKHSIVLMTTLLALVSCGGSGGGKGGNHQAPTTNTSPYEDETDAPGVITQTTGEFKIKKMRKVELEKDFSNFDDYKKELNTWKVEFNARSESYKDSEVVCKKITADVEKPQSASFDPQGIAVLELSIGPSDKMEVEYFCKISDRENKIVDLSVKIKKSILVSGKKNMIALSLSDSTTIETLVLEEGAILLTDGNNVNLTMNELISKNGKIVTFEEDANYVPQTNEPGKSGGIINLVTQKAHGTIAFELRGLPAGIQTALQADQFKMPPVDPSLNGRGKRCGRDFGIGKQGHPGIPGNPGVQGHQGGDAGLLLFRSFAENTLKMNVKPIPGAGGIGGQGGKGGQGGPGGIGAQWTAYWTNNGIKPEGKCRNGSPGVAGPQGSIGQTGHAGNVPTSNVVFQLEKGLFDITSEWSN